MMGRTVQDTSSTGDGYGLGKTPRRAPSRPFSPAEESYIKSATHQDMDFLYGHLTRTQHAPRHQRLVQEAIERKRANG